MANFYVEILTIPDHKVEKKIGPYKSERMAERAELGVNINLNHEKYYTDVVESQDSQE